MLQSSDRWEAGYRDIIFFWEFINVIVSAAVAIRIKNCRDGRDLVVSSDMLMNLPYCSKTRTSSSFRSGNAAHDLSAASSTQNNFIVAGSFLGEKVFFCSQVRSGVSVLDYC